MTKNKEQFIKEHCKRYDECINCEMHSKVDSVDSNKCYEVYKQEQITRAESRIDEEVCGQFILDKMLCSTEYIIYAKKHQFIDKQGTINYYKLVTIDTKGHLSKYIKDLSTPDSKWFMGLL